MSQMVLEVGAGTDYGPPFPEVEYVVTDPDLGKLESVRDQLEADQCTALAVSGTELPVPNRSLEAVVARNVVSDPLLAVESEKEALLSMVKSGNYEGFQQKQSLLRKRAVRIKDAMLREAGRTLVTGGMMLLVEHRTPYVTRDYLKRSGRQAAKAAGLVIAEVDLAEVAPPNYAERYADIPGLTTWALTKAA